jgi:hypothetical protein
VPDGTQLSDDPAHEPPEEVSSSGRHDFSSQVDAEANSRGVPVYVMLPLDTIRMHYNSDGSSASFIQNELALNVSLLTLKQAGVKVCPTS